MARPMSRADLLRIDRVKPMSSSRRNALLGTFAYRSHSNGRITITDGWDDRHIVMTHIPQLQRIKRPVQSGKIPIHQQVAPQLQRAFELLEQLDLLRYVLTYDGCFVPRHMGWNPSRPLSTHSWGAAIDLNADWNGLNATPAGVAEYGTVRPFLGVMEACGFGWGGWWTNPIDGMHFEIWRLVPEDELPVLTDAAPAPPEVDLAPYRQLYESELHEPLRAVYSAVTKVLAFDERRQAQALQALNEFNSLLVDAGVKGAPAPEPAVPEESDATPSTDLQKRAAQAIVNIFETGSPQGDYGQVTLLPGDAGHLTYGRSQTTLASGNLYLLIKAYVEAEDAAHAESFKPYLNKLKAKDLKLDHDDAFRSLLKQAGRDPVMMEVQDAFFDRVYWSPAMKAAENLGLSLPLSLAVVYDSHIHGSWGRLRDRTTERHGSPTAAGEKAWISHYVAERRNWLATHSRPILHKTVYRMDAFRQLIDAGNWYLQLPFKVRGIELNESVLRPPAVPVPADDERILLVSEPLLSGDDVKRVQEALGTKGYDTAADGTYSQATAAAVKAFQKDAGLKVDGIVGPATRAAMDIA